ncbi:annexin D3-like [Lactuca sativa]|uniref:annexin D3-like n=1 Tax=Lactuca sativa TaxID=4236 RepID=UPI000CD86B53|nr:annexin D3-like [Lactuca sativa]
MATLQLPQQVPSPAQDSETLRKAFQGCITDEKAMIKLLGHRNAAQRKNIGDTYQELYNQSLVDSLNSKLSGDFGRAVMLWTCEPLERDVRILHKVLNSKQIGMNELAIIIEICFTSSPSHWRAIRDCYNSLFESNFHHDMSSYIVPRSFELNLLRFIMPFRKSLPTVDLDSDIKDTGDDMLDSLVKIMIRCIVSPEKYLAEVIRAAM